MAAAAAALPAALVAVRAIRGAVDSSFSRTEIVCDEAHNEGILRMCPSLRHYVPTAWLPDAHFNTIFATWMRSDLGLRYTRDLVRMPDGGTVAVDYRAQVHKGDTVLLILHGLTGGSQERYVQHLIAEAE